MALRQDQQFFIDRSLDIKKVRDCISSVDENDIQEILESLDFKEGKDFQHQFALHDEETLIVVDFCFPKQKVIIEADGNSHKQKQQRLKDITRDKICSTNGYGVIRIPTPLDMKTKIYWRRYLSGILKDD